VAGTSLASLPVYCRDLRLDAKVDSSILTSMNADVSPVSFSSAERLGKIYTEPVTPPVLEEVYVRVGFVTTVNVSKSFFVTR